MHEDEFQQIQNVNMIENLQEEKINLNEDLEVDKIKEVIKASNDNSLLSGWKIVSANEFKIPN